MDVKKVWTLEFWQDGKIVRYHTFEAAPEDALKTADIYRRSHAGTVVLALIQPRTGSPETSTLEMLTTETT